MSNRTQALPAPSIITREKDGIRFFTDDVLFDATGIRIAFTYRDGGFSTHPYTGLNLATHVGDDPAVVARNRDALMCALGVDGCTLLVPNQVHGDRLVRVLDSSEEELHHIEARIAEGCDGLIVDRKDVAALLCFADCVPVILVSPDGTFAVVHAGWRGVMARIVPKALKAMTSTASQGACADDVLASELNIYIGPHIRSECFETSEGIARRFGNEFGDDVLVDARHVDLEKAIVNSVRECGANTARVIGVDACTQCNPDMFYSYRAEDGVCGRHGAFGVRTSGDERPGDGCPDTAVYQQG